MIKTDILILGGGLTGLTCAHALARRKRDFLLVERQNAVGGVIRTVREDGFVYETGPNTGVLSNAEVADLFEDLKDYMTPVFGGSKAARRYVLKGGKWHALPSGPVSGISTPLFTWKDKFRLLGEPFRKPGTDPHETLADLVKRRMGPSFLRYAIDPFILGVYAGDPAQIVPKYALPKLYNLEQEYGSFIGGSLRKQFTDKTPRDKRVTRKVFSVEGGLSNLTDALCRSVGHSRCLTGIADAEVAFVDGQYLLTGTDGNGKRLEIRANRVVSTVGAFALRRLFPFLPEDRLSSIEKLHYTRVVEVAVGFNKYEGMPLDGFGALIPHAEKRNILGIMFMSTLFPGRAPEGGALVTIFMGGVRRQDLCDLDDREIRETVARELIGLLGLRDFSPDLFRIIRHAHAIPQYRADSGERYDAVSAIQNDWPGLFLAGNLRDGIGMADRIRQGRTIAESL